jgi:hypothetical protein
MHTKFFARKPEHKIPLGRPACKRAYLKINWERGWNYVSGSG